MLLPPAAQPPGRPAAALTAWATQPADPALRGYLDVAVALLASRGQTLEIGPLLHRLPDPPGLGCRHDRVAT